MMSSFFGQQVHDFYLIWFYGILESKRDRQTIANLDIKLLFGDMTLLSLKLATSPSFFHLRAGLVDPFRSYYLGNASITSSKTSCVVFPSDDSRPVSTIETKLEPVDEKCVPEVHY
jgi:hypothetical protein